MKFIPDIDWVLLRQSVLVYADDNLCETALYNYD